MIKMNTILKEILVLDTAVNGGVLSDEELAAYVYDEYGVNGEAFIVWLGFQDIKYFDDKAELTRLILEDDTAVKGLTDKFDERFEGEFDSVEEFAQSYFYNNATVDVDVLENIGIMSAIDWSRYWDSQLRFQFENMSGYYWRY